MAADESCTGRNLVVELQQNDPTRYAAAVKEAEATPNGQGIFWKIEKSGLAPSWLLGSMHVTDPRVLALPPRAQAAHDAPIRSSSNPTRSSMSAKPPPPCSQGPN